MHISHVMYGGLGGHGSVVFSLIAQARKEGGPESFSIVFYGIEEVRDEYRQLCQQLGVAIASVPKGPGLDAAGQRAIAGALAGFRPDAVLAHSQAALPAAWGYALVSRARVVYVEHQSNALKSRSQWIASALAPWLCRRVVLLSQDYARQLRDRLPFLSRTARAAVIPNGIDLDRYCPAKRPSGPAVRLGMQARLNATKDFATLLQAVALLPATVTLEIAGDGEDLDGLKALAGSLNLGDRVRFLGMLGEDSLIAFLQSLDIYVHATNGETMSTAIMQAQACGLPIVVSDVLGVHHQVDHGVTGWLVPPKDATALAQAIERLAAESLLSAALGTKARQWAEAHYDQAAMLKGYRQALSRG